MEEHILPTIKVPVLLIFNLIPNTLDYCNAVLACATATDLKPLQKIQNRAAHFAFRLKPQNQIKKYQKFDENTLHP